MLARSPDGSKAISPDGVSHEADEVAPSLRWATARPERASGNGAKTRRGQFTDEPDF